MTIEDDVLKELKESFTDKPVKRNVERQSDSDNKSSYADRAIKQYIDDCAPDFKSDFLK